MTRFNLSDWSLAHRSLVWYLMLVSLVAGSLAYVSLGREEDPAFTVKTMVISAAWPGASAEDTARQVTERIERKLEELATLDRTRSLSSAGRAIVYVDLQDTVRGQAVSDTWLRVRNLIEDIRGEFPQGVLGPFYDDRFGDVYGSIYAFEAPALDGRELLDIVESARSAVLGVPDIGQIAIIGEQERVIYVEISTARVAALQLDARAVVRALQAQTAVQASGMVENAEERIRVRVVGTSSTVEQLERLSVRSGETLVRLGDIASVRAADVDPPEVLFRFEGRPAVALAIGMRQGANLLDFGAALDVEMERVRATLPLGVSLSRVADQPRVVDEAIGAFTRALLEAVIIVLAISFLSLGLRAGLVITVSIPLVLAITFVVLQVFDITLQRVSLGALIIALGLLVDDAMIAVEMMIARLEAGDTLTRAATHIYTSTAFPMLTGTLVTVVGFVPIGLNQSSAGEFTFTLFVVIAVALIVSWVVAVLCTPLLGVTLLRMPKRHAREGGGRVARMFSALLAFCLRFRWLTIGVSLLCLALSVYGLHFVDRQFFPESDRPELIVEFDLRDGASIGATDAAMQRFEDEVLQGNDDVAHWSSYVGRGAPRFLLTFESPLPSPAAGQIIVLTNDLDSRDRARAAFGDWLDEHLIDADVSIKLLDIGPPSGKPVQYRIGGDDIPALRTRARELAALIANDPEVIDTGFDWMEPARTVGATVLHDRAEALGVAPTDIAAALQQATVGLTVAQVRDGIYLVDVVARVTAGDRQSLEALRRVEVRDARGNAVPLEAVATLSAGLEQPVVWQRSRQPVITVQSDVVAGARAEQVVSRLEPAIEAFAAGLPSGMTVEVGGVAENSAESQAPIVAAVPLMLLAMTTILMIQLQSFQRLLLVFAIAPFALVGVVAVLLPSGVPMGFVAILGVLALVGILIRNSVILIVQIERLRDDGFAAWQAVSEATEHRMRPIALTAAAATLALIPISRDVFWAPMAYAMMGGIVVGTVLTLLFLPALYVAWFRLKPQQGGDADVWRHTL